MTCRHYEAGDGTVLWDINCIVRGDALIKIYHLKNDQHKVASKEKDGSKKKYHQSMFRFSFHTAFVPLEGGGLILKKEDLDIYRKPQRLFSFHPSRQLNHTF